MFFELHIDHFDFSKFLFLPFQNRNGFFCQRYVTIAGFAFRLTNPPFANTIPILHTSLYVYDTLFPINIRPLQSY